MGQSRVGEWALGEGWPVCRRSWEPTPEALLDFLCDNATRVDKRDGVTSWKLHKPKAVVPVVNSSSASSNDDNDAPWVAPLPCFSFLSPRTVGLLEKMKSEEGSENGNGNGNRSLCMEEANESLSAALKSPLASPTPKKAASPEPNGHQGEELRFVATEPNNRSIVGESQRA